MKRWLKNNSLSLVFIILFFIFWWVQSMAGYAHYNNEQQSHNEPTINYAQYIVSGDFIESTFENWESEFLQMAAFVVLTAFLLQKGSAESKKLIGGEEADRKPKQSVSKDAPWPVKQGGWVLTLYEHSLSIAFALLFILSFVLHAFGGAMATCEENQTHGESCPTVIEYVATSKFWFESMQNWQSEFLAVFAMVVLSIYLRQKGSTQSKPVNSPHAETGS
jgi:hypothetical protein